MRTSPPPGRRPAARRSFFASRSEAYTVRMMGALALSLFVVAVGFRVPLRFSSPYVGWDFSPSQQRAGLDLVEVREQPADGLEEVPATVFDATPDAPAEPAARPAAEEASEASPAPRNPKRLQAAVLDFAEQPPEPAGGLRSYYLNIQYPRAAIEAGIQGRLLLSFVVELDGATTQIEVVESLHPLCDSAAVHALRATRFLPGRQQGQKVRVRMRLPVRFQILPDVAAAGARTPPRRSIE